MICIRSTGHGGVHVPPMAGPVVGAAMDAFKSASMDTFMGSHGHDHERSLDRRHGSING